MRRMRAHCVRCALILRRSGCEGVVGLPGVPHECQRQSPLQMLRMFRKRFAIICEGVAFAINTLCILLGMIIYIPVNPLNV